MEVLEVALEVVPQMAFEVIAGLVLSFQIGFVSGATMRVCDSQRVTLRGMLEISNGMSDFHRVVRVSSVWRGNSFVFSTLHWLSEIW